jgi:hypothetical protein
MFRFLPGLSILIFMFANGCGASDPAVNCLSGASVVSISLSPTGSIFTFPPSGSQVSQPFTATPRDLNGNVVCGVSLVWSDTGNISCVDQTGRVFLLRTPIINAPDTVTVSAPNGVTANVGIAYSGSPPLNGSPGC